SLCPCHPGCACCAAHRARGGVRSRRSGGDGVAVGSGQHWWSDALNDPWRNPDAEAVVVSSSPPAEPPPPPFPSEGGTAAPTMRMLAIVAVVAGLIAGALGGAVGY